MRELYGELPRRLQVAVSKQRQAAALDELQLLPPGLSPRQRQVAQRILAAASVPVWLRAGQQLHEAACDPGGDDMVWEQIGSLDGPTCYLLDEGAQQ